MMNVGGSELVNYIIFKTLMVGRYAPSSQSIRIGT